MNDELMKMINVAIKEEEYFSNFYAEAAENTEIVSVKELLKKLSAWELTHKQKLQGIDVEKLHIPPNVDNLEAAQELMLTPITEFRNLKETMRFAIENEAKAQNRYLILADSVEEPDTKELFNSLSKEEERHAELLEKELVNLGI